MTTRQYKSGRFKTKKHGNNIIVVIIIIMVNNVACTRYVDRALADDRCDSRWAPLVLEVVSYVSKSDVAGQKYYAAD